MIQRFKKFIGLSGEEKRLFLEAYVTLGMMRTAILTVSFKRLTQKLEHSKSSINTDEPSDQQMSTAKQIGNIILKAAGSTPWESACLVQSLTAQRMLQKRGIPGVFYLGVMKDEEGTEKMKAHAWSKCGETILTGGEGHEKFTVLSVFGWGKK